MRQDCARPSAARAPTSSGNTDPAGAAPTSGVAAATALQATRLASITRGPPTRSATKPRGTCVHPAPVTSPTSAATGWPRCSSSTTAGLKERQSGRSFKHG